MGKLAKLKPRFVNLYHVLEEFLLYKEANGLAKRTLEDYKYHVESFLKANPNIADYETLRSAVLRYMRQPCSAGYRNIKLRYLKGFFNWAVKEGYLPANPTDGIRAAKEDLSNVRHVSLDVIKKLLKQPDKRTYTGYRDYCIMLIQIDTGVRPGELFQITVADLNLESREIYIRPEVAKTRVSRTLVISPYTAQALIRFIRIRPRWWPQDSPLFATEQGGRMSVSHWAHRLKEYSRKIGVNVTPYSLRHSFAIEFLKNGGDPFSLQRLLGHQDLSMTRRYLRLTQDDIREAHEKAAPVAKLMQLDKRASRKLSFN